MSLLEYFQSEPVLLFIIITFLGLVIGSFFNVVIHRLPIMMMRGWKQQCEEFLKENPDIDLNSGELNLFIPRSRCPKCDCTIKAWHNIPLLSYLFLRGKCAFCQTKISARYPLVELSTALLAVIIVWHFGFNFQALAAAIFTGILVVLTFIDLDQQLLPDDMTLSLLWLGLFFSLFGLFSTPQEAIIGALSGYLSLWLVAKVFYLLTKKEGMGYGDFKLFAAIGAWLGWQLLPLVILFAAFTGAIVGILAIVCKRHDHRKPIPFGPFLAIAGWIALLFGESLNSFYLELLF